MGLSSENCDLFGQIDDSYGFQPHSEKMTIESSEGDTSGCQQSRSFNLTCLGKVRPLRVPLSDHRAYKRRR